MAKGKKKKRIRFKIKNIIVILLVVSFVLLMIYCGIKMPINNIYINGNEILSDDEIIEMVDIENYPSFILTNRFEIKKTLGANSYIEDVSIKKRFGNILEINIVEYRVIASNMSGKIILSSGEVMENTYEIYDVPLLINDIVDSEVYELFATKMGSVDSNILRQVSEIEYSPVEVDKNRFLFYMSDGNLVHVTLTKLDKLEKYNKIKDTLEGRRGIIYLDSGDYVEFIN